jgi:FkbM family methyltransferase
MSLFEHGIHRLGSKVQKLGLALEQPGRLKRKLLRTGLDEEVMQLAARPYVRAEAVKTILDVGANQGQFARTALHAFPAAKVFCFEPLPSTQLALRRLGAEYDGRVEIEPCALGDSEGLIDFNVTTFSPSSSILPLEQQEAVRMDLESITKVPIRRLSAWAAGKTLPPELVVKLDVQGYEATVLRGGVDVLRVARIVIAETCFAPLYKGQASLGELCGILEPLGFSYREAFGVIRDASSGLPLWQDSVFVRSGEAPA